MDAHGTIRIGTSGWRYPHWRGSFYPPKLAQRKELSYAAERFPSLELNGSFYSMQRPSSYRKWADETPAEFVFAIKGPRFVTHMLKLRNVGEALANFWASGLLELGPKLGPVLWQFAPQMRFDRADSVERFTEFFRQLPRTHGALAGLAHEHHPRFAGRVTLERAAGVRASTPIRHCVEIRHESFATPEFIKLLRKHRIGLVVADTVEWPLLFDVTADFVYLRLHGSEQLYVSGYEHESLETWADRIVTWAAGGCPEAPHEPHDPAREPGAAAPNRPRCAHNSGAAEQPRDVYVYFDNDAKVRAPFDAMNLIAKVNARLGMTGA